MFVDINPSGAKFFRGREISLSKFSMRRRYCLERGTLTVANLLMSSSEAPSEASPSSCENWAKLGFARSGMCPNNSWQQSLWIIQKMFKGNEREKQTKVKKKKKRKWKSWKCACVFHLFFRFSYCNVAWLFLSFDRYATDVAFLNYYSRFRCVEGIGRVSNVLRTVEHAKSKPGQKISRWKVTGYGSKLKSSCS